VLEETLDLVEMVATEVRMDKVELAQAIVVMLGLDFQQVNPVNLEI
jgi:hypothetical protein